MKTILLFTMMTLGAPVAARSLAYRCFDGRGQVGARVSIDEAGTYFVGAVPLTLSVGDDWHGVYAAKGVVFERAHARPAALRMDGRAYVCREPTRYGGFERNERTWAF